jgi:spermidine synthase
VLRRVLQHNTVRQAVMVEIDGAVIRLVREFMPGIAGGAWDDPRAHLIVGDGIAYAGDAADGSFDVIIVDSTDPAGPGEGLFTAAFYRDCARILSPRGLIVNQSGVPFMQAGELHETTRRRAAAFTHVSAYVAAVPTYVGGFMTLGIASQQAIERLPVATLEARAARAGVLGTTSYWSPAVHNAAFELPPYIARVLAS